MRLDRIIAVRNNKTVYRDGDRCLKMFSEAYTVSQVLREAQLLASVAEAGLPVPCLLGVTIWEGKWTIITEYIHGSSMRQKMDADPPEQRVNYLSSFVRIGEHIHSTVCPALPSLIDKLTNAIEHAVVPENVRPFLRDRLCRCSTAGDAVCHGDFDPTNVILTGGEGYRILDWSHAAHGDPAADAACTYLLLCRSEGKPFADAYLARYEEVANRHDVRAYLPLAAVLRYIHANEDTRAFLMPYMSSEYCI